MMAYREWLPGMLPSVGRSYHYLPFKLFGRYMKKKLKTIGKKKVLILSGEITGFDAIRLFQILEDFKKDKHKEFIVDLRNVEHMGSNCLGALAYSQIVLNKYNKKLVLSASYGYIKNLFRDCLFDQIFEIVESY